jgi:hypothetical protein
VSGALAKSLMREVSADAIASRRLAAHGLLRPAGATAADVVRAMGAVQAQDSLAAKWAIGVRLPAAASRETAVDEALAQGSILRVHAMRWTWQLVAPEDVRWILALVGPRMIARSARRFRELGLDEETFRRCRSVLDKTVGRGDALTRDELRSAFAEARADASKERLSFILGRAELDGVLCSGPLRGRKPTWALLDRWAPPLPRSLAGPATGSIDRSAAITELARRYFTTRGPAALDDFVWWSGLTIAEARAGLDDIKESLVGETFAGRTTWRADRRAQKMPSPSVHLLPAFDEYFVAYRDRDAVVPPERARRLNAGGGMLSPAVIVDGKIAGVWRRVFSPKQTVVVTTSLFAPLSAEQRAGLAEATRRYARFLGRDLR